MSIWENIVEYYRNSLNESFDKYFEKNDTYEKIGKYMYGQGGVESYKNYLPNDYLLTLSDFPSYQLGKYKFGVFQCKSCSENGLIIQIANCAMGMGNHSSIYYLVDKKIFTIYNNDDPTKKSFESFHKLLLHHLHHLHNKTPSVLDL